MTTSVSGAVSVQGPAQQGSGGSLRVTLLNDKSGIDPAFVKRAMAVIHWNAKNIFSSV